MSLNTFRKTVGKHAVSILGVVTFAMVVTTFAWNWAGRGMGSGAAGGGTAPTDVIAKVDGVDILRGDYDNELQAGRSQMMGASLMMTGYVHQQVLDNVLLRAEAIAAAKRMGITATPADKAEALERHLKAQNLRQVLGLPATATVADIDSKLQEKGQDRTVEEMWPDAQLSDEAILSKLMKKLQSTVVVTDQDVKDSYKSWHTRHILVDNKKHSDEQAQKLAADLLAKAKAPGADFAALAKQYSDDPGSKPQGGDDNWITTQTPYVPEFLDAVKTMKPGDIVGPVKSAKYGYFIIKCEGFKDTTPKDFDKQKEAKRKEIEQTKDNQVIEAFTDQVKSAPHVITITDPGMRADYEMSQAATLQPTDPGRTKQYQMAIADYQKAIAQDKSTASTPAYQIQLASAYEAINDKANALKAREAAATSTDDPEMWMQVGNGYRDQKDDAHALVAYANASKGAYDNASIHFQLQNIYKQMGKADLSAQEAAQAKQLQASQAPPPGAGNQISLGGQPITINAAPGSGGKQNIVLNTKPAKGGSAKPGQ